MVDKAYVIVKRDSKWCLLSRDRSKVLGCHGSRDEAIAQERAIEAGKNNANVITLSAEEIQFISPAVGAALQEHKIEEISFAIPSKEELASVSELTTNLTDDEIGFLKRAARLSWPDTVQPDNIFCTWLYKKVLDSWAVKASQDIWEYEHGKAKSKRKRLPDSMSKHKLEGVEIFATGKHNGEQYSEADLDEIVKASKEAGFTPPLKLGHDETPGRPAVGWLENLRREGKKLLADITNIPKEIFEAIRNRAYDRVSAEIYWNLTVAGKKFRRALKAVALLGADVPAVTSLKPLHELFGDCTGTVKQYDFGKWSEDNYTFDGEGSEDNEGDKRMADKDLEKLQATVKKLTEELDAAKKTNAKLEAEAKDKTKDDGTKKHDLLAKQLQATQEQLGVMKAERTKERIGLKCNSMKIPSLRPFLQALYEIATEEGADGKPKIVKFAASGKAEEQKDVSAETVLDELIATVNKNAAAMLVEYAQEDGQRRPGQEQVGESAADEVHQATLKYCTDHKKDPDKDYMEAMHAVLAADQDLAQRYTDAQAEAH